MSIKGMLYQVKVIIKTLIILAILGAIGYGGWMAWTKFIKKTNRISQQARANQKKNIEKGSGTKL